MNKNQSLLFRVSSFINAMNIKQLTLKKYITKAFSVFLLLISFNLFNTSLAQSIPEYPGNGVYFEFGDPIMLSDNEVKNLEEKLLNYQAQTDWEMGIIIAENYRNYNSNWSDFLDAIRNKNYTPNGLLLLVDEDNRKTHLFVSPSLENAGKWKLSYSDYVLDSLLLNNFKAGNYAKGLEKFVDYSLQKTGNYNTWQKIGFFFTMFLLPFLFFNPVGWILIAVSSYFGFFFIKKNWYIYKIKQIYQENLKLYQADFLGLKGILKNKELLESGTLELTIFNEKVEQFFEQKNKTYKETKNLYVKAEKIENDFTEFVSNAETWDQKMSEEKITLKKSKDRLDKSIKNLDL